MFFTAELQTSEVYVFLHQHGLLTLSKHLILVRKIGLHAEYVVLWGRAGRPGTSSSPRDCLGSLTPRQLFHINLTLSQTIRCPAFSPLAAVSELTPGRADRVGQATSTSTKARLE